MPSSFFHTPTELLSTVSVPADRSRRAKFVRGVRTTPLAGVTYPSVTTQSPRKMSSIVSGHVAPACGIRLAASRSMPILVTPEEFSCRASSDDGLRLHRLEGSGDRLVQHEETGPFRSEWWLVNGNWLRTRIGFWKARVAHSHQPRGDFLEIARYAVEGEGRAGNQREVVPGQHKVRIYIRGYELSRSINRDLLALLNRCEVFVAPGCIWGCIEGD